MGALGAGIDRRLEEVARAHGFSVAAAACLHRALAAGGGMAQFSHPELGGLGQWAGGGMTMIGEMGNAALRRRVTALCEALAALPAAETRHDPAADMGATDMGATDMGATDMGATDAGTADAGAAGPAPPAGPRLRPWWPEEFGQPASSGAQGEAAYAWFPRARRLAVRQDGKVAVYDTGEHGITGLSQGGAAALRLHAGAREIDLAELAPAEGPARGWTRPGVAEAAGDAGHGAERERFDRAGNATQDAAGHGDDPIALIERLAGLRAAGVLTEREFVEKKTELLARV